MTILGIAGRYLDALVSHEADTVPLAPDVRRIDNGRVVVEGAEALRDVIRREPAMATGSFRWLVDGDDAIVFYDIDADMGGDDRRDRGRLHAGPATRPRSSTTCGPG